MTRFFVVLCALLITLTPFTGVFAADEKPAAGAACDPKSGACSTCPSAAACASCEGGKITAAADEKAAPEELPLVNTQALKVMLSAKVPMVLLDARTGKFDDGKRLPGAKALAPDCKAEEAAKVIPAKDAFVVTYCANLHCPASHKLLDNLKKLGYTNVAKYPDGIEAWVKAGNEVVAAK